jgi:Ran GTPase-activating protein 1
MATKSFSLKPEGYRVVPGFKGERFDTAEQLEPFVAPLRANDDVEEVEFRGNTFGPDACKLLGEVLASKKKLKVR